MVFGLYHQRHTFFNGQGQEGVFNFSNKYTGNGLADFLAGYPASVVRAFPISLYGSIGNWYDGFVQDNWRARPDLTINVGLRYEHAPFYNSVNGQNSAIDYSTGKIIIPTRNSQVYNTNAQPEIPLLLPLFADRLESSETLKLPESLRTSGPGIFAPRAGFAYRVGGNDTTVVRAAYGLFPIYFDSNTDLKELSEYSDFLKMTVYHNLGGWRMQNYITSAHRTMYGDMSMEQALEFEYKVVGYQGRSYDQIPYVGLDENYVLNETKRCVADVEGTRTQIWPGLDVDISNMPDEYSHTNPMSIQACTKACLEGGGKGIVISRKYSEMKLANLAAVGDALREMKAI